MMMHDGKMMKPKEKELIGPDGKMHNGSALHTRIDHNAKKSPMKSKM